MGNIIYLSDNVKCFTTEIFISADKIIELIDKEFNVSLSVGAREIKNGYGLKSFFYCTFNQDEIDLNKIIKFIEVKFSIKCLLMTTSLMMGCINFK